MGMKPTEIEGLSSPHSISYFRRIFHALLLIILLVVIPLHIRLFGFPQFLHGSVRIRNSEQLSQWHLKSLDGGLNRCKEFSEPSVQYEFPVASTRSNPRWNPVSGQNQTVLLRNATLFDGSGFTDFAVDILFGNGIVKSVSPSSEGVHVMNAFSLDLQGKYVTPGLIDMHSHHLVSSWPDLPAGDDVNEMHPSTGPLTPFLRSLDSMKPYDLATEIIASGGVTASLILPGSANIMGGEGFLVKNLLKAGKNREEVVEELLLENGVPIAQRRRYMKMAVGENPHGVYGHTRMGNAWILRQHLEKAKNIRKAQDSWCLAAEIAREAGDEVAIVSLTSTGALPDDLEMESTVALLRGQIGANIHGYEVEDLEDMMRHSREFGFRIQAFHHALEAWKIPELLKDYQENITIATFSTFGLYKREAYRANLAAGRILAEHGVSVAYKSDHSMQQLNAQHLIFQAATGHAFGLQEDLALQAVTSVPARSLQIEHRVGFVKPGYDADIVVWDSHPLSVGATPLQVYIDGISTLDPVRVMKSLANVQSKDTQDYSDSSRKPRMRRLLSGSKRSEVCDSVITAGEKAVITGITKSYLSRPGLSQTSSTNLTLLIEGNKVLCFDFGDICTIGNQNVKVITLENGHILPGITAYTNNLGLAEIVMEDVTLDGALDPTLDVSNVDNVVFAKYGIHLEGKGFDRAKIGGVTRAITSPFQDLMPAGFLSGVSVGFRTVGDRSILDGGIFQDDVALHFVIGDAVKVSKSTSTISTAISKLRRILFENKGNDNIYGRAANGSLPVVVNVHEKYAIMQLIKLKKDHGSVNLIIYGGADAPSVATELARAKIPVIFTSARGAPDTWETRNALSGPPLTQSPVALLADAGVKFGLAIPGFSDAEIFNLPIEASWAAKFGGLSNHDAINLVSRNIEEIMGLEIDEAKRDFVVWEGDPLQFGANVAFTVDGESGMVVECWPEAD